MIIENSITYMLWLFLLYISLGIIFCIAFLIKGIDTIDENVPGSSWGFKIIIIPGVILLWPALLKKWKLSNAKKAALK